MHALAMLELHAGKEQLQQQQRSYRQRPRSKELQHSYESIDRLDGSMLQQQQQQSQRQRHHHHHHHHQQRQQQQQLRSNHMEQEERDDTEDNLADEEFEDDEVGRDVRQKRLLQSEHNKLKNDKQQQQAHNEELGQQQHEQLEQEQLRGETAPLTNGSLRSELNVINDELKYGAAHHNHQSMDSNPLESQSEWSDDDCREEATGRQLHK